MYNLWLQLWIQIQKNYTTFSKFPKKLYLQSKLCIFNENCNFLPQFHFLSSKLTISFVLMAFLTPHYLRFDFLMISSWFLYDFLMISSWFPHDFFMISSWFLHGFLIFKNHFNDFGWNKWNCRFLCFSANFSLIFHNVLRFFKLYVCK